MLGRGRAWPQPDVPRRGAGLSMALALPARGGGILPPPLGSPLRASSPPPRQARLPCLALRPGLALRGAPWPSGGHPCPPLSSPPTSVRSAAPLRHPGGPARPPSGRPPKRRLQFGERYGNIPLTGVGLLGFLHRFLQALRSAKRDAAASPRPFAWHVADIAASCPRRDQCPLLNSSDPDPAPTPFTFPLRR